jgi:hypothetical protein
MTSANIIAHAHTMTAPELIASLQEHPIGTVDERYMVRFHRREKKGSRRVWNKDARTFLVARDAAAAISEFIARWAEEIKAGDVIVMGAQAERDFYAEIEIRAREKAHANSRAGQAEAGARQLAAIRAARAAKPAG